VTRTGIVAVSCLLAAHLVAADVVDRAGWALAVGGILIGIPHGAADHLVPFWSAGRGVDPATLTTVLVRYVAVLAVALGALLLLPVPAVWIFLIASGLHFGRGEVALAAESAGRPVPSLGEDRAVTAAFALVTVGLPLAAWPQLSLPALDRLAPGLAATPRAVPAVVLGAAAVLVPFALLALLRQGRTGQAGELCLLAALFATVPPMAAFGVYFGMWHALRHTLRLVLLPGPDGEVDAVVGLSRYLRGAALPTLAAGALLFVLWHGRGPSVLAAELALLVGLTAPHLGIVAAMDRATARREYRGRPVRAGRRRRMPSSVAARAEPPTT
jgi:Brp/Blh family beta-carotene 15,15'-monooxygenase